MNIIDFNHIFLEELRELKNNRFLLFSLVLLFLFLMFFLFFSGVFLYIDYKINNAVEKDCKEILFSIREGEGLKGIAARLEKENLVNKDFYFVFYVFSVNASKNLQAGDYVLDPCMSPKKIADKIIKGEAGRGEVKVTIPEGFNLEQIETRLVENGLVEPGEFKNFEFRSCPFDCAQGILSGIEGWNLEFLKDKPQGSSLEGYLFPDTYLFDRDSSADDIIKKMLDNFDEKLTEDLREEIKNQDKTIYDILTMASMIEKEVRSFEDKKLVSGILWKRLDIGMALQVDATITYITDKKTAQLTYQDLDIDSPYNTYKYKGLPPRPICNPGLESIKAAIYPERSDFWYYLSKPDGQTIFSETLQEHNEARFKYLQK